jgi:putative ABC transport system permease protein
LSFVKNVAVSSALIGVSEGFHGFDIQFTERPDFEGVEWPTLGVDEDFIETFDIKMVSGRDFDKDRKTDQTDAFIVNRAAANQLGGDLLGEEIELSIYTGTRELRTGEVIGIMEDFHYKSLYEKVDPLVLYINKHPNFIDFLNIKLSSDLSLTNQIEGIEEVYKEFNTDKPVELLFIDDEIEKTYQRELAGSRIMLIFTILSIFIAALGVFGLATYSFRRRGKEMGIRKVLGASYENITIEVLKEYLALVAIACAISWPLVYYSSSVWLDKFAYSINFGFVNYLYGLLILIVVVLLSNLQQVIGSIRLNPVEYLKDE